MHFFRIFSNWVKRGLEIVVSLIVPDNQRIESLLKLNKEELERQLPRSKVDMKDVYVLFEYGNRTVKFIIKSIKYKNNWNLKKLIARFLYEEILELSSEIALFHGSPPVIVPMPMSKNEKIKKGFNQCEELCREIQKLDPSLEIYYDLIKKIKETKRQTELSKEERLSNVKNSMRVFLTNKATIKIQLKNRVVIVLDDVYTTLASFSEARRALTQVNTRRVIGLFIAH